MLVFGRHKNESVAISPWDNFAAILRAFKDCDPACLNEDLERLAVELEGREPIKVVLMEIRGDKVRLGFEAPLSVLVHRREVWDAIQRGEGGGE